MPPGERTRSVPGLRLAFPRPKVILWKTEAWTSGNNILIPAAEPATEPPLPRALGPVRHALTPSGLTPFPKPGTTVLG